MKTKSILLLSIIPLMLLTGCNNSSSSSSVKLPYTVTWVNDDGTVLEVDENVDDEHPATYDGATPSKDGCTFKGWKETKDEENSNNIKFVAEYEEIPFDNRIIGSWYVFTSTSGVVPQNFKFTVTESKTVILDSTQSKYTLKLKGLYAGFENTFLFYYGTIQWIVSYSESESNPGVDWGYKNVNETDMGFARATEYTKYEYEGKEFPNAQIKAFLKTNVDIIPFESNYYYLDLFESALYNCNSADIEVRNSSLDNFKAHMNKLVAAGYVFNSWDASLAKPETFYIAYDSTKTYSVRCIYFADTNESHVFYYNYLEKLHA